MAESNANLKLPSLVTQAKFVGADYRFAGLSEATALAEFIPLTEASASAVETSVSVPSGGVVPEESDDDCLSLGSGGGDTSPIRQSDKDLLDGRSWCEEMEHQDDMNSKELVVAKLAELDGGETLSRMLDS